MEFPLTRRRVGLAFASPTLRIPLPLTGARERMASRRSSLTPQAVITGSVNSSELTLFDPVIHASAARYTWMAGSRFVLRPAKPVRWARLGHFEAN